MGSVVFAPWMLLSEDIKLRKRLVLENEIIVTLVDNSPAYKRRQGNYWLCQAS